MVAEDSPHETDVYCIRHHVPILALRGRVMFPGIRASVALPPRAVRLARELLRQGRAGGIGFVAMQPGTAELYNIGTFCKVVAAKEEAYEEARSSSSAGGGYGGTGGGAGGRVLLTVEGCSRLRVLRCTRVAAPFQISTVQLLEDYVGDCSGVTWNSLLLRVQKELLSLLPRVDAPDPLRWPTSASGFGDVVGVLLGRLGVKDRQQILETIDVRERLELILPWLHREARADDGDDVSPSATSSVGESRMQWPLIGVEYELQSVRGAVRSLDDASFGLGDEWGSEEEDIVSHMSRAILEVGLSADAMRIAKGELKRLKALASHHSEYIGVRTYLETLMSLPWKACTVDSLDLPQARAVLDGDHFGLEAPKKRILEFLAVRQLGGSTKGPILCLEGPPGIGKTSLGFSVAKALGRKFTRLALGGMRDEAELRGHRRTYIGSAPGAIIQGLQAVGVNNPVLLLDEIDKLTHSAHFNPQAVLLEILDPEQNIDFRDHYLNTPFDLSRVLFMCTSNNGSLMDRPLLDRLELLELTGYTAREKEAIARSHLLPKQRRLHGLQTPDPEPTVATADSARLTLSDMAISALVEGWASSEGGVRRLERLLGSICRWAALQLQQGAEPGMTGRIVVDAPDLEEILGSPLGCASPTWRRLQTLEDGVAPTLSELADGNAEVVFVEAACAAGCGGLTVTGGLGLGPVAREAMLTAVSTLRSQCCCDEALLSPYGGSVGSLSGGGSSASSSRAPRRWRQLDGGTCSASAAWLSGSREQDLYLHLAASCALRDSSAIGLPTLLAAASLLLSRPVRSRSASSGEVSLRGVLLPVDSVREKVLAAHRAGVRLLLLPLANRKQVLEEVPSAVLAEISVRFARDVSEAMAWTFDPEPALGNGKEAHSTVDGGDSGAASASEGDRQGRAPLPPSSPSIPRRRRDRQREEPQRRQLPPLRMSRL